MSDEAWTRDAKRFLEWLREPGVGLSAMAIGYHMLDVPIRGLFRHPPADSADFARCEALLQIFPHWRPRMAEMKDKIGWARAVAKLGGSYGDN